MSIGMSTIINIAVVDSNRLFLQGFQSMLPLEINCLVTTYENQESFLDGLNHHNAVFALVDINLLLNNEGHLAVVLKKHFPKLSLLALYSAPLTDSLPALKELGIMGLLAKHAEPADISNAFNQVSKGIFYYAG